MSLEETYQLLKNRIGWEDPPVTGLVTLSADNKLSDSGRYYQEEHSAITLKNIHSVVETVNSDSETFNKHLEALRKQAVKQVIADVFQHSEIWEAKINDNLSAFDTAISKRMAVVVLELMITSSRSNEVERISGEFANKLFYDLYGKPGNESFNPVIGILERYEGEMNSLRDLFNTGNSLDVYTLNIGRKNDDIPELR